MRIGLIFWMVLCLGYLRAQVFTDFENEALDSTPDQFTPAWVGNTALFTLVEEAGSKMLRSNAGQLGLSGSYYISTPSTALENSVWEFFVNLKFATSGANYVDVYLTADDAELDFVNTAYVLRIGETSDRVVLYRYASGVYTQLLASADGVVNSSSNNPYNIRVSRDDVGNWTLEYDKGATGSFLNVGAAFDDTYTDFSHFLINIVQSTAASPANNHFFDNIRVGEDTEGPVITSATALSATSVDVQFNEPLDPATAESATNYALDGGATVSAAVLDNDDPSLVHLTTSALTNGQEYVLTVNDVEDVNENAIATNSSIAFSFLIVEPADYRDVVINEFMADGVPPVALPETDFVELYNVSDKYIDLAGWRVGNSTANSGSLSSYIIPPGGYLIVCGTTFVSSFEVFGPTRGVTSFPNFTHTSANAVVLLNAEGAEMDRVNYTTTGLPIDGVTFEQVNPTLICSGGFNFRPSEDIQGGTPGAQNSVFMVVPDNFPPEVSLVRAITADSLRVDFSEVINPTAASTAIFTLDPPVDVETVTYLPDFQSSLILNLSAPITPNVTYTLRAQSVSDCAGNTLLSGEADFLLGANPNENDILLSEILFNPRTDGVDFVEIFNPSNTTTFELRGWKLARLVEGNIDSPRPIADEGLVIKPREFVVFTTSPSILQTVYPQGNPDTYVALASMPSYNDSEGVVVLLNADDEIVEQFNYEDDYHYSLLKSKDGVSLERISYEADVNDPNNWRSAASTVGFATPGRANSQSREFETRGGKLLIEPKVFLPGNAGTGRDFTTIHYSGINGATSARIIIYDQNGRPVRELANGASLATSGFFRWDGVTDTGRTANIGYYVVVFELYGASGERSMLKETVVVGRDF